MLSSTQACRLLLLCNTDYHQTSNIIIVSPKPKFQGDGSLFLVMKLPWTNLQEIGVQLSFKPTGLSSWFFSYSNCDGDSELPCPQSIPQCDNNESLPNHTVLISDHSVAQTALPGSPDASMSSKLSVETPQNTSTVPVPAGTQSD